MSRDEWRLARRTLDYGARPLVMGILNVTPDSFSDGGQFFSLEAALARAAEMIAEGADIIDIGGESTRPGAETVPAAEEMRRVVPLIERLAPASPAPLSIDTFKATVARAALDAGAEIVNDISGGRFEPEILSVAAEARAGVVLMHSRGAPGHLHGLEPVSDIMMEVANDWRRAIAAATARGVAPERIALDPGIGFGKTPEQNLELIAKLDILAREFGGFPLLVGASRKSFIGRLLDDAPAAERLAGSLATVAAAVLRGARIIRAHDVRATIEAARVAHAIRNTSGGGR